MKYFILLIVCSVITSCETQHNNVQSIVKIHDTYIINCANGYTIILDSLSFHSENMTTICYR